MDLLIKDADILRNTITSLKSSLLQVDNENRNKQSVGLIVGSTILSRVFGTLMGWFTHRCLNNLRNQISEVQK
jgi:ABC-type Fe3+ transport system permease subunit